MNNALPLKHTPPLGYAVLTPLYDLAIAILTRENIWRSKLVDEIAPTDKDVIVDVGSGTGSLAKRLLTKAPRCRFLGIDPNQEAIVRARKKLSSHSSRAKFLEGFLTVEQFEDKEAPTKIVSSLVLHQVSLQEKSRILRTMHQILAPAGACFIADYGYQKSWLSKKLFRLTVQALDGVENTSPNAQGILPELMRSAGFEAVTEVFRVPTFTGVISIYKGLKDPNFQGE